MNREVLLLVAIFVVASLAAMIRNIAFTLAGERFVARLRRNVSVCVSAHVVIKSVQTQLVVWCYNQTGNGFF